MLLNLPKRVLAQKKSTVMRPERIIEQLGLMANSRVLELGHPVGFFADALHKIIGDDGLILIAAPNEESLEKMHDEVSHIHTNTTTLADVLRGQAAPQQSLDLIILTNLLSSVAKAENFCLSIDKYLKPTGQIVVVDWQPEMTQNIVNKSVSREEAIALLNGCNLVFDRMLSTAGYHYGLVFRLPK